MAADFLLAFSCCLLYTWFRRSDRTVHLRCTPRFVGDGSRRKIEYEKPVPTSVGSPSLRWLVAILLVLNYTPLGYLQIGPLSASLLTVPVAIGAMTMNPMAGAILGGVFGATSFIQAVEGKSAMGAAPVPGHPAGTFCGLLCGPCADGTVHRADLQRAAQGYAPRMRSWPASWAACPRRC